MGRFAKSLRFVRVLRVLRLLRLQQVTGCRQRASDRRVQQVTSTPRGQAGPIWSPDGRMIAFSDVAQAAGQPLCVVRRDTAGAWGTPAALGQRSYGATDRSPDSRRLAVVTAGGVDIVDVQSGKRTVIRPPSSGRYRRSTDGTSRLDP